MAKIFEEIFGSMLLTMPVEKNETVMPSPEALRKKILLKHKKLPEGATFVSVDESAPPANRLDDSSSKLIMNLFFKFFLFINTILIVRDLDLSNSEKNGVLYLEDKIEREWVPHFFVLSDAKLFYTEVHPEESEPEEAEEEDSDNSQQTLREVLEISLLLFTILIEYIV